MNTYGYVGGNPLKYVDPTGRSVPVLSHTPGSFIGWLGEVGHYGIERTAIQYARFNAALLAATAGYQIGHEIGSLVWEAEVIGSEGTVGDWWGELIFNNFGPKFEDKSMFVKPKQCE